MTGPEHYKEAELLTASAAGYVGHPGPEHIQMARLAQAHATLALAAATAINTAQRPSDPKWREVAE